MMIKNKTDLAEYMACDMEFYHAFSTWDKLIFRLTQDPAYLIYRYIIYLRKEEYYFNCKTDKIGRLCGLWYLRRKNKLGNKLGFKIPRNTFEYGLTIYHHGMIIVNEDARIGKNAKLHGGNCIGNKGLAASATPIIGDNLDLGFGAAVLGNVRLDNNVIIGANSVVLRSFEGNSITLVGQPARIHTEQLKNWN